MSSIDQFESVFRSATKTVYHYADVALTKGLILTDLGADEAAAFADQVCAFLSRVPDIQACAWQVVDGGQAATVGDLLALVEAAQPDLICTYRNLHSGAWRWPYTLGDHVEVLTQVTTVPIMLLPRPGSDALKTLKDTDRVLAITDHLTGDDRLVNYAVAFTQKGGTLSLSHVEDEATLNRYVAALGRTPKIDTDAASAALNEVLLKEPRDYIDSARRALEAAGIDRTVEAMVQVGRELATYRQLVREHSVDLLVLNTKDHDQMAMHGLAYPLAVELRDVPMLML